MPTVASEAPEPSMAYRLHASELVARLGTNEQSGLSEAGSARSARAIRTERARRGETCPGVAAIPVAISGCARHPASRRHRDLRGALGRGARRGPPVRSHCHLCRRAPERGHGLCAGVARRGCRCGASRDVGCGCLRDPRRRAAKRPASQIVPGDIILIEEGDTIAADGRLIEVRRAPDGGGGTHRREPAGHEGYRARSPRRCHSAIGTTWSSAAPPRPMGTGKAVVTATGMRTEMGRIAGLLKATPDETTPLQRELDRTGKILGLVVVAIAVIMIVTIVVVEDVRGVGALFDVLILGVALAVAAVPEGLPAVVTAVLSIGVQRMARRNAIVRHLAAVETLGSATVIASDKTGTLTKNEMTVRVVVTASGRVTFEGSGYAPEGAVRARRRRTDRRSRCGSNSNARWRSPIARTTPPFRSGRPVDRAGRSDGRRAAGRCAQGAA